MYKKLKFIFYALSYTLLHIRIHSLDESFTRPTPLIFHPRRTTMSAPAISHNAEVLAAAVTEVTSALVNACETLSTHSDSEDENNEDSESKPMDPERFRIYQEIVIMRNHYAVALEKIRKTYLERKNSILATPIDAPIDIIDRVKGQIEDEVFVEEDASEIENRVYKAIRDMEFRIQSNSFDKMVEVSGAKSRIEKEYPIAGDPLVIRELKENLTRQEIADDMIDEFGMNWYPKY